MGYAPGRALKHVSQTANGAVFYLFTGSTLVCYVSYNCYLTMSFSLLYVLTNSNSSEN